MHRQAHVARLFVVTLCHTSRERVASWGVTVLEGPPLQVFPNYILHVIYLSTISVRAHL